MLLRLIAAGLLLSWLSLPVLAQEELPFAYAGDGLTVIVTALDEDAGKVSGTIERNGQRFPFIGTLGSEGDCEVVTGTFTAGGKEFPFRTRQAPGSDQILFTTGNKTYRLLPRGKADVPPPPQGLDLNPDPARRDGQPGGASLLNEPLKRVVFRDLNMGGVVSHQMFIPLDWTHEGHIEWSTDTYYPQTKVKATGPDGSRVTLMPAMTFTYTEVNPVPGFPQIPPQGEPPPQQLGEWVVSVIRQNSPGVSNVRLISDQRDPQAEAQTAEINRQMRPDAQGETHQVHQITYSYDQNGKRFREQWLVSYYRMAPMVNENIRSITWALYPVVMITAPEATFEQARPRLMEIYGTFRHVPRWWVQMMELRSEIIAQRHRDVMDAIRRRGQMYDQMSDAQFRAYKEKTASEDRAQAQRIQSIYEVQDYRDRDGTLVELSIHPKHVFSDGRGNLILTNNYNDRPGSQWEEIRPAR